MTSQEEREVNAILAEVNHPAIARSLADLGIVKRVEVEGKKVKMLMLYPFPEIPIKEMLINSVKAPLEGQGYSVEIEEGVMDDEQRQAFLSMEQQAWTGM